MDIGQLILERRTIHNYKSDLVSESLVVEAIEKALFAPNHKHTQPWLFYSLKGRARETVAQMAAEIKAAAQGQSENEIFKQQIYQKFLAPSHLIVIGQKKVDDNFQAKEDYASVACGVQNIQLFLWSKGVGTKWSTGRVTRDPRIFQLIQRTADEVSLEGFLWIGIAEKNAPVPPKAKIENCYFEIE